eukprot:gnl/MRDRNA2_/MRDRNA2_177978_c0_seq1.p1 gnl/MRDRNA2_/MRDRNA2_177978_c0~~gnl/MRDRNA2_/MRDRNA2_177978_c0_seq1.p1  ORF type:complete len:452 (+),score=58.96 gnl/MRDRNA2_/MRDRNA2_177978_c0_seq1:64-1419(+)
MSTPRALVQATEHLSVSAEPCWWIILSLTLIGAFFLISRRCGERTLKSRLGRDAFEMQVMRPPSFAAEVQRRTYPEQAVVLPFHQQSLHIGFSKAEKPKRANEAFEGCLNGAFKAFESLVSEVFPGLEERKGKIAPEVAVSRCVVPNCPITLEQGNTHLYSPGSDNDDGEDGDPEESMRVAKLRERISDLLDTRESNASRRQDVLASIARYGGERSCLTRFLRAHGDDVGLAEKMLRATMIWREEAGVNSILQNKEATKVWQRIRPIWPAVCCRVTPNGNPIIYFRLAHMNKLHHLASEKDLHVFYRCWMEMALQKQREGASFSPVRVTCIPGCLEVYDCQGCGLSSVKCLQGLSILSRVLSIGQKYYPENMHQSFFLNAPSMFEVGWRMVRGVLDERAQQRISIHKDGAHDELCRLLGSPEAVTQMIESISEEAAPDGTLLFKEGPSTLE